MRNTLIITLTMIIVAFASCGGGSDNPVAIKLRPTFPGSMSTMQSNLEAVGTIRTSAGDKAEVVAGPASGELGSDGVYTFHLKQIGTIPNKGGAFWVNFYYTGTKTLKASEENKDVLVATVILSMNSSSGGVFTAGAENFDTSADDDADGKFNLDEVISGLDPKNPDTDGDGVPDGADAFPSVAAEWGDLDGDGVGDNSDDDIDGDGLSNEDELLYGTSVTNPDSDDDGKLDGDDNCRTVANADQKDTDDDGKGDLCEDDTDGDGLSDADETNYGTDKFAADTDNDGLGDLSEINLGTDPTLSDTDSDGKKDGADNCPKNANASQLDTDRDKIGDACDIDKDNDGFTNTSDNCPLVKNPDQEDDNEDGEGNACDSDIDGDGFSNEDDTCPYFSNPAQSTTDADNDQVKAECDLDERDANVGAKESAVFVDVAHGSDANDGSLDYPLASISAAIPKGKNIYVAAGTYSVANVIWQNNVKIFGGFKNSGDPILRFSSRSVKNSDPSYQTILTKNSSDVTIYLADVSGVIISGFYIQNTATTADPILGNKTVELHNGSATLDKNSIEGNGNVMRSAAIATNSDSNLTLTHNFIDGGGKDGGSSVGLLLDDSYGKITNNIIKAGGGRFATGVEIQDSSPLIVNNTIDGRSGSASFGVAKGVLFSSSSPIVVNNLIFTGEAPDQYVLMCEGSPPTSSSMFKNNLLGVFPQDATNVLAYDCDDNEYHDADFSMGSSIVSGNLAFTASDDMSDLVDVNYDLAGGDGVDDGIYTHEVQFGNVVDDYYGTPRPQGSEYDIGAIEKL